MNLPDGEPRAPMGRRTHAILALAYGLFAIYGSLVPLNFRPLPLDQALARFSRAPYFNLGIDNADFVANILLFIPLAYLALGALRADRRGWIGDALSAFALIAFFAALSIAIEFTQVFFPGRTVSVNDMIAETSGGIIGTALWLAVGRPAMDWVRNFSRERERPALVQYLLFAYCVGFVVSQLMPMDLTINLGQLAQKYRNGTIMLRPFGYTHPSRLAMVWDYLADIILTAPLGAAAAVVWTRTRRRAAVAIGIGVAMVILVELAQVFVRSRYADVTDLFTGSLGVTLGVGAAMRFGAADASRAVGRSSPVGGSLSAALGAVVWIVVLLGYHWYPFNFTVDPVRVKSGVSQLLTVPFSWYYWGTEFHAFTEASRKTLLALPLGVLFRLAWPRDDRAWVRRLRLFVVAVGGFGLLFGIETGQVFLPGRTPDITDAIIGEFGVLVGFWLAGVLASPLRARTSSAPPAHRVSLGP